jgi:hypothetical protein
MSINRNLALLATAANTTGFISTANLSGTIAVSQLAVNTSNANNITSGTLPSARLSGSYSNITGVGTLSSITFSDSTTQSTAAANTNQIAQIVSQTSSFSTLSGNTIVDTTSQSFLMQNGQHGGTSAQPLQSGDIALWSNSIAGVQTRGTYYGTPYRYIGVSQFAAAFTLNGTTVTGPLVKNYSTSSNMVVNLYCQINKASDDGCGWYINYSDNGGAETLLSGSTGSAGGTNQNSVVFNGTDSVPPNTVRKYRCYASVLSGSGTDHVILLDFYTTFNSWA